MTYQLDFSSSKRVLGTLAPPLVGCLLSELILIGLLVAVLVAVLVCAGLCWRSFFHGFSSTLTTGPIGKKNFSLLRVLDTLAPPMVNCLLYVVGTHLGRLLGRSGRSLSY